MDNSAYVRGFFLYFVAPLLIGPWVLKGFYLYILWVDLWVDLWVLPLPNGKCPNCLSQVEPDPKARRP